MNILKIDYNVVKLFILLFKMSLLQIKNYILKKAKKNKPLTKWEKRFNKLIGKTRFRVERTFGGIKRWFDGGLARYRGIEKMHTQNVMEGYVLQFIPKSRDSCLY